MFDNIDELIEVNMKLLYTSKSQYMMRINFKDEYGFNLKNSKAFADILVKKGLVLLESSQGFRCDLTDLGRQIYQNGGWMRYLQTSEPFSEINTEVITDSQTEKIEKSFLKKILIASIIILVLCFFISLITVQILHKQ
ncbi:hypothetical protein CLU83_3796 [Flavobacterium sp. 1]|uniref:hypothetical protein n=1 Tax=Flavobacterium sp. 1 TaxID=2035200 RepID=UPI000C236502|nr:hypothetical protein [Flavobacterium sp. 1]PJJ10386.1 hypothetical protein CLU83_3796 [Flavobacterium sp. 1]